MSWHEVNDVDKWDKYEKNNAPVFIILWYLLFLIIGAVYLLFTRDLSGSMAVALAGIIMIMFGLLDVGFFWLSSFTMTDNMCWFNESGHIISKITAFTGHECVTAFDLYFSSVVGVVIAFVVFKIMLLIKFDDKMIKKVM
jgi:hypothetical protein